MFCFFGALPQIAQAQTPEALSSAFSEEIEFSIPPTTIIFDVHFAGKHQGEALITYTDKWAKIHDPEGLASILPDVENTAAVTALFTAQDPPEGLKLYVENVGEVFFNIANFRVEVTLDPAVLKERRNQPELIALEPAKTPKIINNLSAVAVNQLEGAGFDSTLRHRNAFVYGRDRVEWQGSYAENGGYELRSLLAAREKDNTLWRAGLLETRGLEFARSQPILGVGVGSNVDTLFDDASLTGDIVSVFVPSRSRIRAYANGRLVYTGLLDFGLQQLDVTHFPQGSYDLRLELTEINTGKTTVQTQFYTKTNRLVPFTKPEWLVQLGFIRNELNPNTAEPVWQGLYRKRIGSTTEVGASILGSTNLNIIEPQARLFWKGFEARVTPSFSDKGDAAVSAFSQLITEKLGSFTVQMRKTLAGHNAPVQVTANDVFSPLSNTADVFSARWTRTFGRVQLSLQGTQSDIAGVSSFRWGPNVRYPIFTDQNHRLELQGDYVFNDLGADSYGALLTYQYSPSTPKWRVSNQTNYQNSGGAGQAVNTTQIEYDNKLNSQNRGTRVLATNTVFDGQGNRTLTQDIQVDHTTDTFHAAFTGTHRRSRGDSTGSIGLQADTNFIIDGAKRSFVGSGLGIATAIIDLQGTAKGEVMLIKHNGQILGRGAVGERLTLSLQPFKTYNITLQPEKDDALVRYDPTPHQFKLVNAGVEIVPFKVERVYLLFGRLLNAAGKPIGWQRIKGVGTAALTDQFGNFQTEVTPTEVMYVKNEEVTCTAAMPYVDLSNSIFKYVGDILCL